MGLNNPTAPLTVNIDGVLTHDHGSGLVIRSRTLGRDGGMVSSCQLAYVSWRRSPNTSKSENRKIVVICADVPHNLYPSLKLLPPGSFSNFITANVNGT